MPTSPSAKINPDKPADTLVRIGATPANKEAAIREAGQLLVAAGCVDSSYVESILRRESTADTFLGSGVAIPHGMLEDKGMVRRDGIAVLQVPGGLEWNPGQTARFIVGIAATSDSHIAILRRLTNLIQDEKRLETLCSTSDPALIEAALSGDAPKAAPGEPAQDLPEKIEWILDYPAGLHARPASIWVNTAKAAGIPMRIRHKNGMADPRSMVSLLQLGATNGDVVTISAEGPNAAAVLAQFRTVIAGLSTEEKAAATRAAERMPIKAKRGWIPPGDAEAINGISASPGLAIGTVHRLDTTEIVVPDKSGTSLEEGGARLEEALNKTRLQMKALVDDTTRRLGAGDAAIFSAQATLLDDTDLITRACQNMVAGHGVAWSWNAAIEEMAEQLAKLDNPVLAARATDLRDVGRRVLLQLEPTLAEKMQLELPEGSFILIAKDLSPSDTAGLDAAKVAGLATSLGGPTSHTAILARTLGIAAVVATGDSLFSAKSGTTAIVDGDGGRVWLNPTKEALESAEKWIEKLQAKRAAEAAERSLPAQTTDGQRIEVSANVNRPDQVPLALDLGAEGVGLMRTEFLFLERGETPSEDEQYATYHDMVDALDGRPLIVRTLDIGGDKQVAHLHLPHEENPFLGVRGSRLLLRRPDLFEPQMRALYRLAKDGKKFSVMFSMITSVPEVIELRKRCEKIRSELGAPEIPLGIMIEVPAAAVLANVLAKHVDFFSIGTNDLTQYTLAIDRQNPEMAAEADSLHPAVLRLIRMTVDGAAGHKCWVGVCGGIAGDPFGAALLTGIGVNELSMTPRDIPAVKALLRRNSKKKLEELAQRALQLENADEVRALASELETSDSGNESDDKKGEDA